MLFKLAFVVTLAQFFSVGELVHSNINKVEQNKTQNLQNSIDLAPVDDPCPNNQSLHSRSDLKALINFMYQQLSVDEKIRQKYQSTAIAHRDSYLKRIKQFEEWLQNHPQHFKHVLESLSGIRRNSVEPDVKKVEKLMQDNSGLFHAYEERNKTFYHLKKKLQRYKIVCEINCNEDNEYNNEALDHIIFRRNIQEDYICSSLKDLYDKIQKRLSQFLEYFNNESNNRFSQEDAKYLEKIENVTNTLRDKGLQKMSGTFYEILLLQDEYHHFTEKLNVSTILDQINLVKNLSIQADVLILQLSELIEDYGRKCQNCKSGSNVRRVRQVQMNPENQNKTSKEQSKSILDYLLDEKFNETAKKVQHDWENIFKELLDVIDENKNKHLNLEKFEKVKEEINKMILLERQALQSLSLTVAETGVEDLDNLAKLIIELIKVIKELIDELNKKL